MSFAPFENDGDYPINSSFVSEGCEGLLQTTVYPDQ
jgi:hypothetical protein